MFLVYMVLFIIIVVIVVFIWFILVGYYSVDDVGNIVVGLYE